jgi:hypothetical protein
MRFELTGRLPLDGLEVTDGLEAAALVSGILPPMLKSALILSMPRSSSVLGLKSDLGPTL